MKMTKKILAVLLSLAMLAAFVPAVCAASGVEGVILWDYNTSTRTLTISGNGRMNDYLTDEPAWSAYEDIALYLVIEEGVKTIGDQAFIGFNHITTLTIPNGVKTIGAGAFQGCNQLSEVSFPDTLTSIGERAFRYCSTLGSVKIPDSVTSIGRIAFEKCTWLESVKLSSNLEYLGVGAFVNCSSLKSVTIPGSVEVVNGVFTDCTALETVVLEPGVKTIGEQAFRGDTALKNVTIPDTVTEIGEYAFLDTAIESIVIPDSVESIGVKAFCQCDELKTVYYTGSEEDWNNKSLGDGLVTYDPETGDDVPMDVEIVFNYGAEQPATPTEKEPSVCGYCGQVHDTTVVKEFFVSFLHTMLYIGKVFLSISTFGLFD